MIKVETPVKYGFYLVKNGQNLFHNGENLLHRNREFVNIPNELNTNNYIGYKKLKGNEVYYLIPDISVNMIDIDNNILVFKDKITLIEWELLILSKENDSIFHYHNYNKHVVLRDENEMEKELSKLFRDEKIQRLKEKL